jgi:hypothetical protein
LSYIVTPSGYGSTKIAIPLTFFGANHNNLDIGIDYS